MDVFKTLILDTPTAEGATGTVTSVDLTAGTGISVSGGPITSSGSITVTNTSPDQTVALTGGTGISTSGTYPNFTITNDAPDQTVSIASGTGISVTGSYPSFTVTNSSPSSGGDVVGPASATDNAVVRFDSTTGKLIQNSGVTISDADLLTTTDLTVNDDTVLGSSNTDTVNFNARVASEFTPATDNTYDLGRTGHEWRDLYIDGTANIDSLVADTADINGGTIDGATIGATTPSTGAFTTASASTSVTTPSVTNAGTLALSATGNNIITASTNGVERMRITNSGNVGIGNVNTGGGSGTIRIGIPITGAVNAPSVFNSAVVQSDVTTGATMFLSFPATAAEAFTLGTLSHFSAGQGTLGAGSTVTTQTGFAALGTLIGATNNYGFRGQIAAAAGRFNLYMDGTAANYFAGNVGIGTTSPSAKLHVVGQFIGGGTTTNDNASAGNIGEYVEGNLSNTSKVTLTNGVAANTVSISLTAGDWDVSGVCYWQVSGSTPTGYYATITSTSATLGSSSTGENFQFGQGVATASQVIGSGIPPTRRFSLSTTTTIYLVAYADFPSGTTYAYGTLRARRAR